MSQSERVGEGQGSGADRRSRLRGNAMPAAAARTFHAIAATFAREMEAGRGFLWVVVAFGAGILVYFTLPREPWLPALALLTAALTVTAILLRSRAGWFRSALILAAIATGLTLAKVRTDLVAAPVLDRPLTTTVAGWIVRMEASARGGKRIVLRVASMEDGPADGAPANVRVTVRSGAEALRIGDAIGVLANLAPPSGPVMPGGYDFSFFPFYERIGGVGFAYGAAKPADLGQAPWSVRWLEPLGNLREDIRQRIVAALPGEYGHVAAALVMGDQRGISDATQDAMRASGLGHILSISGLHMALVAGAVYVGLRALLALFPAIALRYPIKTWAAAGALVVATAYLGTSGAEVATVRSYVMLAIMLVAVIAGRRALTLRNVALAALAILIVSPESLMSISFQMSFAATAALIAAFEALSARRARDAGLVDAAERTWVRSAATAVGVLLVTSIVAGLATAPFGAYYFQRVAPLTVVANVAVAPAISIIVMPAVIGTIFLMPFGLEAAPLWVMQWGLQWMVAVADATATWSEGWGGMRALPAGALLLIVGGMLWLMLWGERWRWLGVVPIALAIPIAVLAPRPALLVDEAASAVAVRGDAGRFAILGGKGADFEIEAWLRADADTRLADAPDLRTGTACDALGCIGAAAGIGRVALVQRREAFAEDCRAVDVVVSGLPAPPGCAAHALVIDRDALDRFGSHALYAEPSGPRIETAYPEIRRPFMPPVRD